MDSKGEESKISYPNIFFMIDSFEEVRAPPPTPRPGPPRPRPEQEGGWRGEGQKQTGLGAPTLPGVGRGARVPRSGASVLPL